MKIAPTQKMILKRIVEATLHLEGEHKLQTKQPFVLSVFNGSQKRSVASLATKGMVTLTTHEGEDAVVATQRGYTATFVPNGLAMISRGQA